MATTGKTIEQEVCASIKKNKLKQGIVGFFAPIFVW